MAFLTKSAPPTPARDAMTARNGARWFYWIAGLSLVNSVVAATGSHFMMVFGLSSTLIATYIGVQIGGTALIAGLAVAVLVALGFLGLGWMAERGAVWAFATGIALYAADTVLTVVSGDWLSAAAHLFALALIGAGLAAFQRLRKSPTPAPVGVAGAVLGATPPPPTGVPSPGVLGAYPVGPPPPLAGAQGFAEAKAPAPLD